MYERILICETKFHGPLVMFLRYLNSSGYRLLVLQPVRHVFIEAEVMVDYNLEIITRQSATNLEAPLLPCFLYALASCSAIFNLSAFPCKQIQSLKRIT